jgi:NhaC family Na+:H+ antiporter
MGIPLPLVAGMVVSGATFGDKLSPISDTTNLAAMSAETSLYRHIGSMLYTTLPTFLVMLVILLIWGFTLSSPIQDQFVIVELQTALQGAYHMLPVITLLPLLVMMVLSIRGVAPEVTMSASVVVACVVAILYQGQEVTTVLNSLWMNTPGQTGIENLDQLLGRGGIGSMAWTLTLALMALALGGILHDAGILRRLLDGLLNRIRRTTSLIAAAIGGSLLGNLAMGEAYISILLNCQLFRQKFDQQQLDRAVLSRSVEEGATLTTGLIPWTTAGAFYTATLGVSVLEYAPYAILNYLNAFVSVAMAALGIGLLRQSLQKVDQ